MVRGSQFARARGLSAVLDGFEDLLEQVAGGPSWVVGTSVEYGVYLEHGTRNMQPYPWLEPAVNDVLSNKGDELAEQADSASQLIALIAAEIEKQAVANVSAGPEQDRPRSPGTHPDHPRRQSSNLAGDIKAVKL